MIGQCNTLPKPSNRQVRSLNFEEKDKSVYLQYQDTKYVDHTENMYDHYRKKTVPTSDKQVKEGQTISVMWEFQLKII